MEMFPSFRLSDIILRLLEADKLSILLESILRSHSNIALILVLPVDLSIYPFIHLSLSRLEGVLIALRGLCRTVLYCGTKTTFRNMISPSIFRVEE
jgi:hypothetical protein